ncbi:sodium/hydrogen exchanger 6 [Tanacetum coccineum]
MLKKPFRKMKYAQGDLSANTLTFKEELCSIQSDMVRDPSNVLLRSKEIYALNAYKDAAKDDELFLKQRSKFTWLSKGDFNTKYFYNVMKERRNRSRIDNVEDGDGNFFSGTDVGDQFVKHFEKVLGRKVEVNPITEPDHLFVNKLSQAKADCMVRPVSGEEIKAALFGIADDKAPGPDGFSSKFFKSAWSIVGTEFTKAIKDFFCNGRLLKEINATVLALVPKVKTLKKVSDFRPISCCTVLYKCISKVIANRIKDVLNSIVNSFPSAFIPSRQISDNIMLTQELMRNYHRMSGPSKVAFKIDINKANDTRCSKVNLTYLCFADDLMLFSNGDVNYVSLLKAALDKFSGTSGLVPNLEKSFVFFGNVLPHVKYVILNIMQFPVGSLPIRYLEVPLISSRLYKKQSLSCQGKAKVKWEDVCGLKIQGGLGIKSLQCWNVALIIISNKESLWMKWVNSYRLSDRRSCMRNLWDILVLNDVCYGGKKILQIRSVLRSHIVTNLGNGCSTLVWFDNRCFLGPLCQFISKRGVFEAGLSLNCKGLMNLDRVPNDLYQAIDFILARPVNKSIWSIIQRLVLGAVLYFIWQERNLRLFQGKGRNVDSLCCLIKDKVRYRLMSLRVKYSNQVAKAADIYGMFNLDKVLRKDVGSMEGQENLG